MSLAPATLSAEQWVAMFAGHGRACMAHVGHSEPHFVKGAVMLHAVSH